MTTPRRRSANRPVANMTASPRLASQTMASVSMPGDRGAQDGRGRGAGRAGLGEPADHRVARGDVGRHEHRHLGHDPVGQPRVRGEVGQRLQGVHHDAGVVEPRSALVALGDVRTKRGDAESGFAVDQQVDLVGEQVSVIHDILWSHRTGAVASGFQAGVYGLPLGDGGGRLILAYAPAPGEARAGRGGCRS